MNPRSKLKLLVFGAALRADSLNRKLAALAARVAEQSGATVDHASMRDFGVPSYDGDAESAGGIPKGAEELRRRLVESDAFIVSSPEYNGSMPGVFKNLIDWKSRRAPEPTASIGADVSTQRAVGRQGPPSTSDRGRRAHARRLLVEGWEKSYPVARFDFHKPSVS